MIPYIVLLAAVVAVVARLLYNAYGHGVSDIPGPWICKFTNAYRMYRSWRKDSHLWFQELKEEYGNLVRIGPNVILDSEHDEFQKIFGFKDDYIKSESMDVWQGVVKGKRVAGIASAQSKDVHSKLKRPVAAIYSNSNVVRYQPRVTETIKYFIKRLDEEFIQGSNAGRKCDIDNWVQYFAFDIVGQVTLSRRLGFLEQGHDIDGMLAELDDEFAYRGVVQNMPILDRFLRKNPIRLYFANPTSFFAARSKRILTERLKDEKHHGTDMLEGFLEAQKKYPDLVNPALLGMYVSTNFLAGSDTTALTMRAIIWYVLKTPGALQKIREELDAQVAEYPPDYDTAIELKYFDAVVREALRLHPIATMPFERVVPSYGHTTNGGKKLPPNTILAITAWTFNFDEEIWGPEPQKFKPERWLKYDDETQETYEKRVAYMKHNDFSFSYGPRGCLGKHLAWMELIETMPTLFGLLDLELADPNKEWKVSGAFFSRQSEMDIKMKWREGVDKTQILS